MPLHGISEAATKGVLEDVTLEMCQYKQGKRASGDIHLLVDHNKSPLLIKRVERGGHGILYGI